ncbi:MAG TPA: alpha/beta fold hydrolase [Bacteroidia bacterium]|nr:alpha/beta fold hydrolase [Bacteroidia bacterium]
MKKVILSLVVALTSLTINYAQDITGQWNGVLKVQGIQLRLVFNIRETETGLSATMDSPDQGAKGIPTTTISFENTTLKITIANAHIEYEGTLGKDDIIVGTFKQNGMVIPLNLSKAVIEKTELVRPQEPKEPFPYYAEDVIFENKMAGIRLAGTLTLPEKEGVFPVVILISGSGPQNRNEELMGHKPFLVISDYLTKNGIAVLRYDDRGTAQSKGDFKTATSADFATDVESAIAYLNTRKEINKKKIGLVGHSEGGLIAPMVASKSNKVAFIILLAGTGVSGDKILLAQQKLIGSASGIDNSTLAKNEELNRGAFEIIKKSNNPDQLKTDLKKYLQNHASESEISSSVNQLTSPWMINFIKYDPRASLEKVKCPVLALNGEKDLQVPPKENLEAIKSALTKGGNKKVTTLELPNLNHLFQECKTGSPNEYATIEQTFSPAALKVMLEWIQVQAKQ